MNRGIWAIITSISGPTTDADARTAAQQAMAQAQAAATAAQQALTQAQTAATQAQSANTTAQAAATSSSGTAASLTQLQAAIDAGNTAHTTLAAADTALSQRISALVPGITTIGRCDFLTVTIALMGSATYTCTLDRPMPSTTYAVSMPTVAGSAFEVVSKTATTVTLKQTANAVAVTAGLRLLLLAYA